MSHSQRIRIERRALRYSICGSLGFVVLAFVFALRTGSNAILFDGIYSLIGLSTAVLTLKVARLAERPDDDRFHLGYTSIEPTINLFKALIVGVSCPFSIFVRAGSDPSLEPVNRTAQAASCHS